MAPLGNSSSSATTSTRAWAAPAPIRASSPAASSARAIQPVAQRPGGGSSATPNATASPKDSIGGSARGPPNMHDSPQAASAPRRRGTNRRRRAAATPGHFPMSHNIEIPGPRAFSILPVRATPPPIACRSVRPNFRASSPLRQALGVSASRTACAGLRRAARYHQARTGTRAPPFAQKGGLESKPGRTAWGGDAMNIPFDAAFGIGCLAATRCSRWARSSSPRPRGRCAPEASACWATQGCSTSKRRFSHGPGAVGCRQRPPRCSSKGQQGPRTVWIATRLFDDGSFRQLCFESEPDAVEWLAA